VASSLGRGSAAERWADTRLLFVDNLKVILIAAIIVGHAVVGYGEMDWWAYSEQREVTLSPITQAVLLAIGGPFSLLLIPMLFLLAGLMTRPSLERKGTGLYVRDRLLRLGVVFAAYVLVLQPITMYMLEHWIGTDTGSYWSSYLGAEQTLDTGTLWFVGDLLIFSLVYAGWIAVRRTPVANPSVRREIGARHLILLSGAVGVATFLVRLAFPFNSENKYLDLNLYQWPACVALFGLGIAASRLDWLTEVPERLRRLSRIATVAALVAFGAFTVIGLAQGGIDEQAWGGGWDWSAFAFPMIETTLVVFGPVWLLSVVQRRLDQPVPWIRPAVKRSCYGAFVLQQLVLVGLAIALRPLPLPAEVKALLVASGGLTLSFTLAWLLITRVPGLSRVL
jgi:hypothetical protein